MWSALAASKWPSGGGIEVVVGGIEVAVGGTEESTVRIRSQEGQGRSILTPEGATWILIADDERGRLEQRPWSGATRAGWEHTGVAMTLAARDWLVG